MKKPDASTTLTNRILELEIELKADEIVLKNNFKETLNSLRPGKLLLSTVKDVVTSPGIQGNVVNSLIGMASGFIAKKLVVRGSKNPLTKVLGKIAEVSVANKVGKNADGIRTLGGMLLKKLFHKNGQT